MKELSNRCRITFETKKGTYIYGHLTQTNGRHGAQYVSEDMLTAEFMEVFKSIQMPEYAYNQVSEALRSSHDDKKRVREVTLQILDTEIAKYQQRTEKIYEDYLDEKLPESLY